MSKYQAYRDRIRQDPIKLEEYRRKERERKKMYRHRKGNVPPPLPESLVPHWLAVHRDLDIRQRTAELEERCSVAYGQILGDIWGDQ